VAFSSIRRHEPMYFVIPAAICESVSPRYWPITAVKAELRTLNLPGTEGAMCSFGDCVFSFSYLWVSTFIRVLFGVRSLPSKRYDLLQVAYLFGLLVILMNGESALVQIPRDHLSSESTITSPSFGTWLQALRKASI